MRLLERFEHQTAVQQFEDFRPTLFFGVPTMYVRILEQAPPGTEFSRVRLFVSGSAALPAPVFEEFARRFGIEILERYGATEFGFALSNRYEGPRHAGTVGFPLPNVEVRQRLVAGAESQTSPGQLLKHYAPRAPMLLLGGPLPRIQSYLAGQRPA